jgi:hypothetical protein
VKSSKSFEWFDRNGEPIGNMEDWAELLAQDTYKNLITTAVGDQTVSTIWLGLNYGTMGDLLIFETMIFPDLDCWRYATEEEAIKGHHERVAELKNRPPPLCGGCGGIRFIRERTKPQKKSAAGSVLLTDWAWVPCQVCRQET